MRWRQLLTKLWHQTARENNQNLAFLLEKNRRARVLDLGCDNGQLVKQRINCYVGSRFIWGIDIDRKALSKAAKRGIKTFCLNLNGARLPFKDNFFDVIQANQIIEHLWDTDTFIAEIYRLLKPRGYVLISTENLSSWHNLFSLFFGFQAPSQDISSLYRPSNPFSLCHERSRPWVAHQRVFTILGLSKLMELYGFKVEQVRTAGYYPLPNFLARIMAKIDPTHTAFFCLKVRK